MSQNQTSNTEKKPYHTPELKKFGSVSDLTLTSPGVPGDPTDGGGGFNQYAS